MSNWPKLDPKAPGKLIETSGTEWLPRVSSLPIHFQGSAYLPDAIPGGIDIRSLLGVVWSEVESATSSLAGLNEAAGALPNPHLLANPFRIREAQASSRIENTIASAEEIALADAGELGRDESMEVRNNLMALEWGLNSERPITQGLVNEMHQQLLSDGVRGSEKTPGAYRRSQAYISGGQRGFEHARFVPPPAEHVQASMDALFEFVSKSRAICPAVVSAAIVHYQFETIHPFSDGNGRVGRMMILIELNRAGLLERPMIDISSFFDRFRDDYYDLLLAVSLEGKWADWIQFFCRGLTHQAQDARKRATRLLDLRRSYIERVTEPRASALLRECVDYLFSRPAVRTTDLARHLDVLPQAAQRHLNRLVEKGILFEITGRSSRRVYVAKEIINSIEEELD